MDFREYQIKASKTDQKPGSDKLINFLIPILGLVGEMGSTISEFKKRLRDGKAYQEFTPHLEEELGDVLWYLSNIATKMNIDLEGIANKNIIKTQDRWNDVPSQGYTFFDEKYPQNEQLPRYFKLQFREITKENETLVEVFINNKKVGDSITDNSHSDDGYRYHDIFHYGFAAYLGWSPVLRKLLKVKRKSNPKIDEVEDGARAAIIEEAISAYIYPFAEERNFFENVETVDYEILKTIQRLISPFEVRNRSLKDWEYAILSSYKIYRYLRKNSGGKLDVNLKNKSIKIL